MAKFLMAGFATRGSTSRDLGPGECMHTPKGTVHAFSNPFISVARALIVQSPDIGEQYFRDIASVVNVSGPPDKAALVAIVSRSMASPWLPECCLTTDSSRASVAARLGVNASCSWRLTPNRRVR